MSADNRSVSTDALATLGTIIDDSQKRDAIHLAVIPMVAPVRLRPGQHVDKHGNPTGDCVGIVDPFVMLKHIEPGDRFWLVIYPRVITSLRHVWSHPAFEEEAAGARPSAESEEWLHRYADQVDADYGKIMDVAKTHCRTERGHYPDYLSDGSKWEGESTPAEFWNHFENVTGLKPDMKYGTPSFFSCSC